MDFESITSRALDASAAARCLTPADKCSKKSKAESRKALMSAAGIAEQTFGADDVDHEFDFALIDGGKVLGELLHNNHPSKADAEKGVVMSRRTVLELFEKLIENFRRMTDGHARAILVMDERALPDDPPALHKVYERTMRAESGIKSAARADDHFEETLGTSLVEEVFEERPYDPRISIAFPGDAPRSPGVAAAFPEYAEVGESLREIFADRRIGSLVPAPFSAVWADRDKARPELVAAVLAALIDEVVSGGLDIELRIVGAERFPVEEAYEMLLEKRALHAGPLGCFGADDKGLSTIARLALLRSVMAETTMVAGGRGPYGLHESIVVPCGGDDPAPPPASYTRLHMVGRAGTPLADHFPATAAQSLGVHGRGRFDIVVLPPSANADAPTGTLDLSEEASEKYNFDVHARDFEAAAAAAEQQASCLSEDLALESDNDTGGFARDLAAITRVALEQGFGLDVATPAAQQGPLERYHIDVSGEFEGRLASDYFTEDALGEAVPEDVPLMVRRPGLGYFCESIVQNFYGEADQGVLGVLRACQDRKIVWAQARPSERKKRAAVARAAAEAGATGVRLAVAATVPAAVRDADIYAMLDDDDDDSGAYESAEAPLQATFPATPPTTPTSSSSATFPHVAVKPCRVFVHANDNDFFATLLLRWAYDILTVASDTSVFGETAYCAALRALPDVVWVVSTSYGACGTGIWNGYCIDAMARALASRLYTTSIAIAPPPVGRDTDVRAAYLVLNVVFLFLAFGFGDYTPGLAGVGAVSATDSILGLHAARQPFVGITRAAPDDPEGARLVLVDATRAFRALYGGMLLVKKRHPKTGKAAHKKAIEKHKADLRAASDSNLPETVRLANQALQRAERAASDLSLRFQAPSSRPVESEFRAALYELRGKEVAIGAREPSSPELADLAKAAKKAIAASKRVTHGSLGGNSLSPVDALHGIDAEHEYQLLELLVGAATEQAFRDVATKKRAPPVLISDAELAARCDHTRAMLQFNLEAIKGNRPLPFVEVSGYYASNGKPIYLSETRDFHAY